MSKGIIGRTLIFVVVVGLAYGGINLALAGTPPGLSGAVTVENTATNPVPVDVTNTSVPVSGTVTVGNTPSVKIDPTDNTVQIGGTPNVNVTNSSLSVAPPTPVTGGGGSAAIGLGTGGDLSEPASGTATAISIHLNAAVNIVTLLYKGSPVAEFYGPNQGGTDTVNLALSRPITFDTLECSGTSGGDCALGWIGASP
jgi:hypothetical protein